MVGIGLGWRLEAGGVKDALPHKAMHAGRSIAARLDIPHFTPTTLVCSYFHDGKKMALEANADTLDWNRKVLQDTVLPAIAAADFNNDPSDGYLRQRRTPSKMYSSVQALHAR